MEKLSNDILESDRQDQLPVKVLQFGEGNFLRAFMDWMIHGMNEKGLFKGRVAVVQPIPHGMIDRLAEQDHLYTLLLRGVQNGEVVVDKGVIQSIDRSVNPYTHFDAYLREAENPDLRIIISNTTEAGIELKKDDQPTDMPASSFPGKLLQLMKHRFNFFNGDLSKGFLFFPCELIECNGSTLKSVLAELAAEWYPDDGAFHAWLMEANVYFNTLVDRIVSGYPKDEAEALCEEFGYEDGLIAAGEIFHFLAIEGPAEYESEFPVVSAGFNVKWCDNLTPYRTRKVRILNGAHTMTVLAAHLYGLETVQDCMDDPVLARYIRKGLFEEIIPTLVPVDVDSGKAFEQASQARLAGTLALQDGDGNSPTLQPSTPGPRHSISQQELEEFAAAVLERFSNPYIRHLLLSISLNSVSKFKTRVLPSLLEYHNRKGEVPQLLTFSLAALILFYRGNERLENSLKAVRTVDGAAYEVNDSPEVLDWFRDVWSGESDMADLVANVLARTDWWEQDLNAVPGLADRVTEYLGTMICDGVPTVLEHVAE